MLACIIFLNFDHSVVEMLLCEQAHRVWRPSSLPCCCDPVSRANNRSVTPPPQQRPWPCEDSTLHESRMSDHPYNMPHMIHTPFAASPTFNPEIPCLKKLAQSFHSSNNSSRYSRRILDLQNLEYGSTCMQLAARSS